MLPSKVSHGGTYAGNRVGGRGSNEDARDPARHGRPGHHPRHRRADPGGPSALLDAKGLAYNITGHPSMFGIMFTESVASEYRDWANTDHELYDAIAVGMHARGAMPEPDSREPWFICEAHAKGDAVDKIVTIFGESLGARRGPRGTRARRG